MSKKALTKEEIWDDIMLVRNKEKRALREKIIPIIHKSLKCEDMRGRDIVNVLANIISDITDDNNLKL